jgi:hypothetical protein
MTPGAKLSPLLLYMGVAIEAAVAMAQKERNNYSK